MKFNKGAGLDFEEVTEGSVVLVQEDHEYNKWATLENNSTAPYIHFEAGDIWVIEGLANRPRVAILRNLQRGTRAGIRVDALLELDDKGVLTVGPA